MSMMKVAVVGAGAAGLCAVRHLAANPKQFQVVCFEKNDRPGGTWIYTDKTGTDDNGVSIDSSMYKNLRTNLPKEVMAFPDFPFKKELPSFIRHDQVLEYLQDYAMHFNLLKHIKFSTLLQHVHPVEKEEHTKWEVTYSSLTNQTETTVEMFDAIMICNGHYAVPLTPDIPGLTEFKGHIMHSHNYRYPDIYKEKRVVCLGAAASGQDISVDISSKAKMVYMSHNKNSLQTWLPPNIEQKPGIKRLNENSVIFNNDEEVHVDCVLLCTGYRYSFPFLSEMCRVTIKDERITPLYKHLIHTKYPSCSFIGILKTICPFPNFHNQVLFVMATLNGSLKLPSQKDMEMDIEAEYKGRLQKGMPERYAHNMGPLQWEYNDMLADIAKFDRIPKNVQILYDGVHETRVKDIAHYKSVNYELIGSDGYKVVEQ